MGESGNEKGNERGSYTSTTATLFQGVGIGMGSGVAGASALSTSGATGGIFGLLSNPYFSAGFGLLGVGTGLALFRQGSKHLLTYARRSFLISMEIPSKDKSYAWFMEWASSKQGHRNQHVSVETNFIQYENGEIATRMQLVPSTGTHFLNFKGRWIRIDRTREKNVVDLTSGSLWETVTLTTIGRNRRIFEDLLEEARGLAMQKEEGSTVIYTTAGGDWRRFGFPRKRRPLHSVILDQGKTEKILGDAREFLQSARWYIDRGIPYRRGYLLYGPPGTGKSSFITALAGALQLNICILSLHSKGVNDDVLNHLLNIAPQRSVILLEDIDAAVEKGPSNVTFSGLLNALDGVAATEGGGRLIFMTTNHIEKLPDVLVRPGRVDVKECLDLASKNQLYRMFLKFYPPFEQVSTENIQQETEGTPLSATTTITSNSLREKLALEFSQSVPPATVSMAQLQGYFMQYKDDPQAAVANASQLLAVRPPQQIQ